jgi:hypothetical protein
MALTCQSGLWFQAKTPCLSTRGGSWSEVHAPTPFPRRSAARERGGCSGSVRRRCSLTLQLRDSAGLCVKQTRHRLSPLGPVLPGSGAPRSAVFNCAPSIADPGGMSNRMLLVTANRRRESESPRFCMVSVRCCLSPRAGDARVTRHQGEPRRSLLDGLYHSTGVSGG